jgi:anaerobic ribonucleoside-triphosphate reductase
MTDKPFICEVCGQPGLPSIHKTHGERAVCTECANKRRGVRCEVYSRIVGYLRPVQNWHAAKRLEFKQRRTYVVPRMEEHDG